MTTDEVNGVAVTLPLLLLQSFHQAQTRRGRTLREMDGERAPATVAAGAGRGSDLLPSELWERIARRLDTHTDLLRFRSVCSGWRSLFPRLPPPHRQISAPFPLRRGETGGGGGGGASLTLATIFRLEPPTDTSSPDGPSPSSRSRRGWLIKISESNPQVMSKLEPKVGLQSDSEPEPEMELEEAAASSGIMRLLNPLCSLPICYKQGTFPKSLDLLEFRITELCKEYMLHGKGGLAPSYVEKVLISPSSLWRGLEDTVALVIHNDGTLCYWRFGQESWNPVEDVQEPERRYDDIVIYKGQFYVVDKMGTVSWLDSSMRAIQFSPLMCGGGDRKHLIEWGGDIFVIDRYGDGCRAAPRNHRHRRCRETVEFKVYRLDQEWGKWDEVRNLGDVAFFLGAGCSFSVSVRDFDGCPGNCIYFMENDHWRERVHVFSLASRSIKKAAHSPPYLQIMWPSPSWLTPTPCTPDPNVPLSIF